MTLSATIPVEHMDAANAELITMGHGPCFSVPLRDGANAATHAGFHAWDDDALLTAVQSLDYPGLALRHDPGFEINFPAHVNEQALEWTDPATWFENPVMIGDQRTHDGKTWESLVDHNVWEPPVAWREVVADGYPAWVQPTGAHDAYAAGERVTHNGQDWENEIDANVWEPGVHGWKVYVA